MSPFTRRLSLRSSQYLAWVADCYCDDANSEYGLDLNCQEWGYDGGDCWANATSLAQCVNATFSNGTDPDAGTCENYSCLDANYCVDAFIENEYVGDNYCDTHLHCAAYQMDGGDCEGSMQNGSCAIISCLNENICMDDVYDSWFGDNYCDSSLNCAANGWDGGDCGEPPSDGGDDEGAGGGCVDTSSQINCLSNNLVERFYFGTMCEGAIQSVLTEYDGVSMQYFAKFGSCEPADDYLGIDLFAGKYLKVSCDSSDPNAYGTIKYTIYSDSSCTQFYNKGDLFGTVDGICEADVDCQDGSGFKTTISPLDFIKGTHVSVTCMGADVDVLSFLERDECLVGSSPAYKVEQKAARGWGYWGNSAGECKRMTKDFGGEGDNLLFNPR